MCSHVAFKGLRLGQQSLIVIALLVGLVCCKWPIPYQEQIAYVFMSLFTSALKLISLPIIFLSLLTSLTGVQEGQDFKKWSQHVLFWTFTTTILAALVALTLFCLINPAKLGEIQEQTLSSATGGFWEHLLTIVPSNPFQPFIDGNVVGILILAIALGLGLNSAPGKDKVHDILSPLLAAMLKIVHYLVQAIPLTVWAGIVLSVEELREGAILAQLGCILLLY